MFFEKFFLKHSKSFVLAVTIVFFALPPLQAAEYLFDIKGAHAFIQFRIKHLGFSWLLGRFNRFDGSFSYDPQKINESRIATTIEMKSIDTNHAERDKHLRSKKFLDVKKYPQATFQSTSFKKVANEKIEVKGNLTLKGVTRPITIMAEVTGMGNDPWGGYRAGFAGTVTLNLVNYGINYKKLLSESSKFVYLDLYVEGIRQ